MWHNSEDVHTCVLHERYASRCELVRTLLTPGSFPLRQCVLRMLRHFGFIRAASPPVNRGPGIVSTTAVMFFGLRR